MSEDPNPTISAGEGGGGVNMPDMAAYNSLMSQMIAKVDGINGAAADIDKAVATALGALGKAAAMVMARCGFGMRRARCFTRLMGFQVSRGLHIHRMELLLPSRTGTPYNYGMQRRVISVLWESMSVK